MKQLLLILFFSATFIAAVAQKVNWKKINQYKPDRILLNGERQPAKVMLLGSFHFGYPNLDGHKTDSSKFIDVKSPQRQLEIKELAEVIVRFKPTRIYVESSHQPWIDSLYNEYRQGRYQLGRNEIFQIGFRIAGEMNHSRVYAVDTWPFSSEFEKNLGWLDSAWKNTRMVDKARDDYWNQKYSAMYTAGDSVELGMTMLENFLFMAEPSTLQRMHGHYLASGFNTAEQDAPGGGQMGPDYLSFWWYNRNLRIYNNILRTQPKPQDRIVVLFGNGHIPILKHCFYSSPEFEVVELKDFLR